MINFLKLNKSKFYFITILLPLSLVLSLSGCDNGINLTKLCNDNTEICEEFSEDNWCKKQRVDVILNRERVKNNNAEVDKYYLLIAYEEYIQCMSLASQIQHIKLKEKTTMRKDNLFKAQANLLHFSEQSANSKHPHLLYYQWSRHANQLALQTLLQLEGEDILENSTAQFHLATYYIKRDQKKTIGLLYRALELHQPGTEISPEILQSLVTIFTKRKQYKQAYIWLRTYQLLQDKPDEMMEKNLRDYQQAQALNTGLLDQVASTMLDKIEVGEFISPNHDH